MSRNAERCDQGEEGGALHPPSLVAVSRWFGCLVLWLVAVVCVAVVVSCILLAALVLVAVPAAAGSCCGSRRRLVVSVWVWLSPCAGKDTAECALLVGLCLGVVAVGDGAPALLVFGVTGECEGAPGREDPPGVEA